MRGGARWRNESESSGAPKVGAELGEYHVSDCPARTPVVADREIQLGIKLLNPIPADHVQCRLQRAILYQSRERPFLASLPRQNTRPASLFCAFTTLLSLKTFAPQQRVAI